MERFLNILVATACIDQNSDSKGRAAGDKSLRGQIEIINQLKIHLPTPTPLCSCRFNEATAAYEDKHREWETLEIERKERLVSQCHQSRLDHLNLDTLVALKK